MGLLFRNVEFDASAPLEDWPAEAIATAIERGTLGDWRPILASIKHDPWGPVARVVEDLIADGGPYGVGPLFARALERSRRRWELADRHTVAAELQRLVRDSGLSAGEFALRLGTSASRMSTYLNGKVVPSAALMVRARRVAESSLGAPLH